MIECPDYLPLGSVVRLNGSEKTLLVIGRALVFRKDDGSKEYYDYGLTPYPEGVMGDALIYSNDDCVSEVLFRGFTNEEDEALIRQVKEVLPKTDVPKGDPTPSDEW